MASEPQLLTIAGVLVILLGVVAYNVLAARRPQRPEPPSEATWIAKFVHHDGTVVGETVAVEGDHLIVKQAGVFKAVPKEQARDRGDEIEIEGPVDWEAAIVAGAAWHEAHTRGQDPAVAQGLTTSDEVRAPALEAFRRRQEEE